MKKVEMKVATQKELVLHNYHQLKKCLLENGHLEISAIHSEINHNLSVRSGGQNHNVSVRNGEQAEATQSEDLSSVDYS